MISENNKRILRLLEGGEQKMATFIATNKVKEFRARHNVSQEELAFQLELNITTFRSKEKCKSDWKQTEMAKVVYFFNSTYGTLYTESDLFETIIK